MLSKYNRVIEIDGGNADISLPIVNFPPFKLRAQLIEKDPVVWLHLVETYVTYFEYLMQGNNIELLDDSTLDHLRLFLRTYLHEIADEEGKLLSLGINHDVSEQLRSLKGWIFILIKKCGLLHLQIFGDSLWDLIKIYVKLDPDSIRNLIDGTLKPQINTQRVQLDKTYQVQQHLRQLIESGKFKRIDLRCVEDLLAAKSIEQNKFAENFFTANWIEILEALWAKGQGRAHKDARELIIISLFSVSADHILGITKELGISNFETLALYPLLGTMLINEGIHKRLPDLKSKLLFLNLGALSMDDKDNMNYPTSASTQIDEAHLSSLMELFPQFSKYQLSQALLAYDNNIELVTNKIFEDPTIIQGFPKEPKKKEMEQALDENNASSTDELNILDRIPSSKEKLDKKVISEGVPDELRNKTLTRALKLLYEADEDERDDTYDEADVSRTDLSKKIGFQDDENDEIDDDAKEKQQGDKYSAVESYLWNLLKEDPTLFERSKRGTKVRKTIKEKTSWSDEKIEGWSRMLERSPTRARLLEKKFMFKGNNRTGKTSYVHNRDSKNDEISTKEQTKHNALDNNNKKQEPQSAEKKKRQHANNEKKKGVKANHNRKKGHDKKLARAGNNGT
ncbi:hypothetical protein SMKI_07G1430 [Saccharomyces mikatae IFO 1815]|uniref:CUE domain-containing protein n=1 Tax=Saccharomyces mikatae IFO 1815 TaxID=226126 RepID=A0AA35J0E0_SACMI|nr:uncharacterized protein SMKI_07G1430 [Saccharomyces mikatae IFO 1815]CAI4039171.1 hypothetical protein SMKI_07G1430 [Saccharomyces mikatae IFO 1815]